VIEDDRNRNHRIIVFRMHKGIDQEDCSARTKVDKNEVINMKALTEMDKELLRQIRDAEHVEEHDDFYHERVIEEQLDDGCIDEEEVAFMMGYLAA